MKRLIGIICALCLAVFLLQGLSCYVLSDYTAYDYRQIALELISAQP